MDKLLAQNSSGRFALLLAEFQRLDPSEFHTAFDSLTPSVYWAATNATFDITREYERTLQQRMEALRSVERAQTAGGPLSESSFPLLASEGGQGLASSAGPSGTRVLDAGFWPMGQSNLDRRQ